MLNALMKSEYDPTLYPLVRQHILLFPQKYTFLLIRTHPEIGLSIDI